MSSAVAFRMTTRFILSIAALLTLSFPAVAQAPGGGGGIPDPASNPAVTGERLGSGPGRQGPAPGMGRVTGGADRGPGTGWAVDDGLRLQQGQAPRPDEQRPATGAPLPLQPSAPAGGPTP